MASPSPAETSAANSDAHYITVDKVISPEQLLRSRERLVTSFLLPNSRRNEDLSELFNIYRTSSADTSAMSAALEEHLGAAPLTAAAREPLADSAARAHKHQVHAEEQLRSLHSSSGERLRRINVLKNVSLVFFTAAASISAGMAALNAAWGQEAAVTPAAAAALVFGTLGGWFHSRLKKREGAEEKRREIAGLMISGAKIAIQVLNEIRSCASDMEFISKSSGEERSTLQVRKKMAALKTKLQQLQIDYRGDALCYRELVVDRIIKNFNHGNY